MSKRRTAQQNDNLRVFANAFDRITLVENFLQRPLLNTSVLITSAAPTLDESALRFSANRNFEVKGTNMTAALATHSTGGGVTLTTAGADNDQAILIPQADTGQTAWATADWSTDDEVAFGGKIKTGASIANIDLWAGLMLTSPATFDVADDDDKVLLYYGDAVSNANGNWELLYSVGGTDYQIDTGVAAAASTHYEFEIAIDTLRYVRLYLNGELVVTSANALTTGVDLIPTIGVEANTGAAKAITVRALAIAKTPND